jgi:prepilin-type processing-associated H-X9-DG protein
MAGYKWGPNLAPDLAIAADRNDGWLGAGGNAIIKGNSPSADQKKINSKNHEQDGQNALFADGHVEWGANMWMGSEKDGIYSRAIVSMGAEGPTQSDPPGSQNTSLAANMQEPQLPQDSVILPLID